MKKIPDVLRNLPGVDTLLAQAKFTELISQFSRDLVTYAIQCVLNEIRTDVINGAAIPQLTVIEERVKEMASEIAMPGLRSVINATGIIIHTNIGRAPFSPTLLHQVLDVLEGYNNLEFDLKKGTRGSRYVHVRDLLLYLTGAEDILVVNNNAAAVMLILHTLANEKEVIISRGELIEIGGSFRMPEIMQAAGCLMREVGTTNKTGSRDYEKAINDQTAVLMKAHRSNYVISGFTQEVSLIDLVALGKRYNIPVVYDMGSGLLKKIPLELLKGEPDVRQTVKTGVDLVCFSGDKLLGGPQAGIIAGNKELIAKLKEAPMTRALRVGKTTLALLEKSCLLYLDDKLLLSENPVFRMMAQSINELKEKADLLQKELLSFGLKASVIPGMGQTGGGSLPGEQKESFAVRIDPDLPSGRERSQFAERMFRGLLVHKNPVIALLVKGKILFNVLTIPEKDIPGVAAVIKDVYQTAIK